MGTTRLINMCAKGLEAPEDSRMAEWGCRWGCEVGSHSLLGVIRRGAVGYIPQKSRCSHSQSHQTPEAPARDRRQVSEASFIGSVQNARLCHPSWGSKRHPGAMRSGGRAQVTLDPWVTLPVSSFANPKLRVWKGRGQGPGPLQNVLIPPS